MMLGSINWFAVLITSMVCFLFGWLWYGPLFGKVWAREHKLTMKGNEKMPLINLLYHFVTVVITVLAIALLSSNGLNANLLLVFIVWFGFIFTDNLATRIWMPKSWTLFLIDVVYHLARLMLIVILLNAFL